MAELFGYTTTQQIVDPSSPPIQVQPNLQASKSFESLSNLMDTAMQAKTQQVQNARMIQNEVDQLKNRIETKERSEAALAKEEAKAQEDRQYTAFNENVTAMNADYTNAFEAAGENIDAQYEAAAQFSLELKSTYDRLPEGLKARVSKDVQSRLQTVDETIAKATQKSKLAKFDRVLYTNMPSVMTMDFESQKKYYKQLQEEANSIGLPLADLGEKFIKAQKSLLMSDIAKAEPEIIRDYDVTSIDNALAVIDNLAELDKRGNNASIIESAREELNGIRKQISDNAVSALKQFAQDGDRTNFDIQFAIVQDIGMVDTPELINLQQDFLNTYFSEKNVAQYNVDTIIKQGGTRSSNGLPTKEKNLYNAWIQQSLEAQIASGNINREFFRQHANNNPKIFAEAFKSGFTVGVGEVRGLAQKLASSKNEQEQQQLRGAIFDKLRQLNTLKSYGYGVDASTELLQATVMETLVTSGAVENIPEALDNINDLRGVELVSKLDKNVKELRDEVPDSFEEAHELYSALIKMKVPADKAKTTVIQRYSMNSIDGMEAEISGAVLERLQSAGIGPDTLEKFEPYLVDMLKADYPEMAKELQHVLNGTNPQAIIDGNDIKYFNEEGSVRRIPLTGQALKSAVEGMTERYIEENQATGVERLGPAIGNVLKDSIYSKSKAMMDVAMPAVEGVEDVGKGVLLLGRGLKDFSVALAEASNAWIENALVQDMPREQANELFFSKMNKETTAIGKYFKEVSKAEEKEMQEALNRAGAALESRDLPTIENSMKDMVESMFNLMFPSAEAAVPEKTMEYLADSEGVNLHLDSANILTMPYGIVPTSGATLNGKEVNARNNTLVTTDLASIDTSNVIKEINGKTFKRADYKTDKEFAKAVVEEYGRAAGKKYSNYDELSDGQQGFIIDMAWNAGVGSANWNDTKTAVAEMSKEKPDYTKVYPVMGNFKSDGKWLRGLMKRRAMAINLMLPETKRIKSIHSQKNADGSVKFYAKDAGGTIVFSRTKKTGIDGVTDGFINVPQ